MRKRNLLFKLICFFNVIGFGFLHAQNLVPNGDLEKFTSAGTIPGSATYGTNFPFADAWVNPLSGSPEYYQVGINAPNTFCCGYRTAHSGTGFKGIDTWGFGEGEHVEAKLLQPLKAGEKYFVSFWLVQSTHYPESTDNFGAHFSQSYWTGNGPPAIQNAYQKGFYPDTTWRMFHSIYTAVGGEEFITLGMVPVPWVVTPQTLPGFSSSWGGGYMFLDDICVYEMSNPANYSEHDSVIYTCTYPITLNNGDIEGFLYQWNTGDTTPAINVNKDGKYWRNTYFPCGYHIDTFLVENADIQVSLGNDTFFCAEHTDSILLSVSIPEATYQWKNGSTESEFWVKESGTYWVTVSKHGCKGSDTIKVERKDLKQDLGKDIVMCQGDPFDFQLTANVPKGAKALWSTGETTHSITPQDTGIYWVLVLDAPCQGIGSIHIRSEMCACNYHVPNAFSPNGDGLNDEFIPAIQSGCWIQGFMLNIYNRFGERVFHSSMPSKGWDGTFLGKPADIGTYFYETSFKLGTKQIEHYIKGDVTLIR